MENHEINDRLAEKISHLDGTLGRLTSLKHQFVRGLISGLGYAIGATVVFAILIIFLDNILRRVGEVPVITPILEFVNRSIGQ